jgi:putative membrane protein
MDRKKIKALVFGFGFAGFAQIAAAEGLKGGVGYGEHMFGYGHGFGFMGIGVMVLFWGAVIALAVYLVRFQGGWGQGAKKDTALDILKERFARGEVDAEEYETRVKVLGR